MAGTTRARRARPTRAEKVQQTRDALLQAAAELVGEVGYAGAIVTLITARANVGQGTFYNYFESRQDLFDQLLPAMDERLLAHLQRRAAGAGSEAEREERSLRGFFEFLVERPEYYRILYEAEVFAPEAYRRHLDRVVAGYTRVLGRAAARGEITGYDAVETEALALILMGARHYLCMRYARRDGRTGLPPEPVIQAYLKLLRAGVRA